MDHQTVNDNEANFVCKDCGETLTDFLRAMAAHNEEIVCPRCGKIHDRADATALAKVPPGNGTEKSTR